MRIETWTSDKGGEEIHHFDDSETPERYLFGFNKSLLGGPAYLAVRKIVNDRLKELEKRPF
jgi:hypothetical protein